MYTSEYRAEIITKRSPLPVPPESSDLYNKLTDYSDKVVLLIHTVNENEFWSAVDHFGPPTPMLRYDDGTVVKRLINFHKVRIYLGEFGGYKAALIQTKMGADCRYEIEEALEIFPNVQAVLALGIGYGNDRGDVMFGDVLVSLKIQDVSNVKFNKDDLIIPRGEITEVRPVLVDIFAKNRKAFAVKTGFVCTEEGRPPSIEDGLVVSAPWLIDNADIKERLLASQPEAIGGEMEGWVLISIQKYLENWESNPRHIGVIVIKGVVDFGDGSKDRNWQMTGAMASIGFADFQLKQTMGQAFDGKALQRIHPKQCCKSENPNPCVFSYSDYHNLLLHLQLQMQVMVLLWLWIQVIHTAFHMIYCFGFISVVGFAQSE